MTRRYLPLLLLLVPTLGSLFLPATAFAHNSLASSDPADGATLETAPSTLTLVFNKSVPLETLSIELIDASGVRQDLSGFAHGSSSDAEVRAPLPSLAAGQVTIRWRLVGPDGHPVTGRVSFSIAEPLATTLPVVPATPAEGVPASGTTTSSLPVAPPESVPQRPTRVATFGEPWATPDSVRWLLRFGSYVAIMTIGGVIATTMFVWTRAGSNQVLRRFTFWAAGGTFTAAIAQLLVVASDIEAKPPWSAASGLPGALETDAGLAFVVRLVLVALLAWLMSAANPMGNERRWRLAGSVWLALLATWAYAGHSRSMRWSLLGMPLDVAHHAAAAAWIGGLAIISLVAIRDSAPAELVASVNRFARLASSAVAVIVGTGLLQTVRLVGSPSRLLSANHGKYLILKLAVLGLMLKVADINRQRVKRRFRTASTPTRTVTENLRRAMVTEFVVGLVVVGVTAVMVVSPPVTAGSSAPGEPLATAAIQEAPATSAGASSEVVTSGAPEDATCALSGRSLQLGATGPDVACLQQALRAAGFFAAEASGTFDEATDGAVRKLQEQRGLLVDGIVGKITADVLGIWPTS